jgi:hypothetical protein
MSLLAERQQQREAEERKRLRALLEAADFKAVIGTPQGRRFVKRVLGECGVHRTTFNESAALAAYLEGKRSVGLWLQSLFAEYPGFYIQLLQEEVSDDAN